MTNESPIYVDDGSLSIEQPLFEKFYNKNVEVLNNLLEVSNQEIWIGLSDLNSYEDIINIRKFIIKWLREINSFRLSKPGVLALSVEIIDYYVYLELLNNPDCEIDKNHYQCVCASAYYLASKLEEVSPISAADMSKFASNICSPTEIMDLEIILSFKLDFNLKFVSPIDFIYSLVAFLTISDDHVDLIKFAIDCYLEVIDNFNVKKFPTFIIAINCIIAGFYKLENGNNEDLKSIVNTLIGLTHPEKNQLRSCFVIIIDIINSNETEHREEDSNSHEPNGN